MEIKIYGTGCSKCKTLFENVQTALDASGLEAHLEKVTDLKAIADAGILMTPALEIDGKIVSSGKILTADEILAILPKQESTCSCCSCQQNPVPKKTTCCCEGKSSAKKLLAYILITIAVLGIAVMLIREQKPVSGNQNTIAESNANVLTVYYFHGNMRCKTCNAFEKLTGETLKDEFSNELASGKIILHVINVELNENAHFVSDFNLTSKSVVLSEPGRFRNLDEIWTRIRQGNNAYKAYIAESIREFMKERK